MSKASVDIAMTVYGKPYQTSCTIFSLLEHCGDCFDKLWFHEEPQHPFGDGVAVIVERFRAILGERLIHYIPQHYLAWGGDVSRVSDLGYRRSIRYQAAFEDTDKDYLFILHNDTFIVDNIIAQMLAKIEDSPYCGVGEVGQCWNCPACTSGLCNRDYHEDYRPTYAEAVALSNSVRSPRTRPWNIENKEPVILPECRLNEYAALLDIRKCRPLVVPNGSVMPIGLFTDDTGTSFFRGMRRAGQRFLNFAGNREHAKFSPTGNGHGLVSDHNCANDYWKAEATAKAYLLSHYSAFAEGIDKINDISAELERAASIGMVQNAEEISAFIQVYTTWGVKRFMEIGTEFGGTFYLLCRFATKLECAISLDLPGICGAPPMSIPLEFRNERLKTFHSNVKVLTMDSHAKATFDIVESVLDGEKLDVLFIDGDHTYKGCSMDFEMYSPLVKSGGWVAFHDIGEVHRRQFGCPQYFDEVKSGRNFLTFDVRGQFGGIGVVQV